MSRALSSFTRLSATHLRNPIASTTTRFFTTSSRNMGVQKTVLVEGNGPSPQQGDVVTMLYTGWLKEAGKKDGKGKQFDTTEKPGRGPFKTPIGVGRVIKGWDEGVVQMKLGEKARLDISSDYAYGSQNVGGGLIPANSELIFEVELKKIN
ncbi:FK506 binding protein proline rotamase rapamycin-binding protein [Didymella heteroderae]|uniref:peptidylprolyl isomerase n=1 Tax=Didymella heteroderae TaxID=1769908 RepID=A0A9P4WQX5_9PLEO|nr:FK506 binding protein proline rotamase rapamycin-binding protein [Didymella heteroderae]